MSRIDRYSRERVLKRDDFRGPGRTQVGDMTGICGIAIPAAMRGFTISADLMHASLQHRGPFVESYSDEHVEMLALSRENNGKGCANLVDGMGSPRVIVIMDGRLVDRTRLHAVLSAGLSAGGVTDAELVLKAYLRWGRQLGEHLSGEFAIVIWDAAASTLLCLRDHFGCKPLYYYHSSKDHVFAFASEIKSLLAHPEVPERLRDDRLREIASGLHPDTFSTSFKDIYRLPPASTLTWDLNGVLSIERYWTLDPGIETTFVDDREYVETFTMLLAESVRDRMTGLSSFASHLSGGLDSSSVSLTAAEIARASGQTLVTVSNVFPSVPSADESALIDLAGEYLGVDRHVVFADQKGPVARLRKAYVYEDEPLLAGNYFLVDGLATKAREAGASMVLTGIDGDSVLFSDYALVLRDMISNGDTQQFLFELSNALAARNQRLDATSLANMVAAMLQHTSGSAGRAGIVFASVRIARQAGLSTSSFARKLASRWRHLSSSQKPRGSFLPGAIDLRDATGRTLKETHYLRLTNPLVPLEFELWDRCHAHHGLEVSHPFWDKRLVEFCYGLPLEQRLRNGYSRSLLRRAIAGRLPDQIVWRTAKTSMRENFDIGLFHRDCDAAAALLQSTSTAGIGKESPVDFSEAQKEFERLRSSPDRSGSSVTAVWTAITFAAWYQRRHQNPVGSDWTTREESFLPA